MRAPEYMGLYQCLIADTSHTNDYRAIILEYSIDGTVVHATEFNRFEAEMELVERLTNEDKQPLPAFHLTEDEYDNLLKTLPSDVVEFYA